MSGSETGTILAGETTKELSFTTVDDEIDEPDGSFTVSLINGTGYTLGTNTRITVNVLDNDVPVISIANASPVVEGTDSHAVFTLTASILPVNPVAINYIVSGDTRFIPSGQETTAILSFANNSATSSFTAFLNIPIHDDEVDEADGVISVTLQPDTSSPSTYTIIANQSAEVTVKDDDEPIPVPVFSINSVTTSVEEPNSAQFRLTTPTALSQPVVVKYNVSIAEGYLDGLSENHEITVEANSVEKIFDVAASPNSISEPDSTITVTLLTDDNTPATYTITSDSTAQSAVVTVIDDDPLPEFSIEHDNFGTLEPGLAMYYLETATVSSYSGNSKNQCCTNR